MEITAVDPADDQALRDLHELEAASRLIDRPHVPPPTLAETRVDWTRAYPGSSLLPLQARLGGRLAGYAWMSLPLADNTSNANVDIVVYPDQRRRGIGRALAAAAADRLRASGRKVGIGTARADGPGVPFAVALGAQAQQDQVRNMLYLDTLDATRVSALKADAEIRSTGYELMRLVSPTPPGYLAAFATMYEVMNDAPHEAESLEDEKWTEARVADGDSWRAARGERLYSILAVSRDSSEPAGLTRVALRSAGDLAFQLETAVAGEHRGHRLGYLLKTSMLDWLAAAEPQVRRISTFNAAGNAHMVAINEALGFVPVERWTFFELAL